MEEETPPVRIPAAARRGDGGRPSEVAPAPALGTPLELLQQPATVVVPAVHSSSACQAAALTLPVKDAAQRVVDQHRSSSARTHKTTPYKEITSEV